jgi:hypothetical protein
VTGCEQANEVFGEPVGVERFQDQLAVGGRIAEAVIQLAHSAIGLRKLLEVLVEPRRG